MNGGTSATETKCGLGTVELVQHVMEQHPAVEVDPLAVLAQVDCNSRQNFVSSLYRANVVLKLIAIVAKTLFHPFIAPMLQQRFNGYFKIL